MTSAPGATPWLTIACGLLGLHEDPTGAIAPKVKALFADAGHPEVSGGDVAWCAAFAGACLERAGVRSTRSLSARSYLDWGEAPSPPAPGAIVVLSRPPDPAQGHVGFFVGETAQSVLLLGGNQGNGVSIAAFAKSRVLGYRWPSPAATVAPAQADASIGPRPETAAAPVFETALAHVLEMEGGYSDDPSDPGGPTNFGITLSDYADFVEQPLSNETRAALVAGLMQIPAATVRSIYTERYWGPAGCALMAAPFAFFHFDTAVNMGVGTAVRMLQTAAGCGIDGEIGPVTLAALAHANPKQTLTAYADLRRRRYRSLAAFARFGRGWLLRVDTTLARALALEPSSTLKTGASPMSNEQTASASNPTADIAKWWGNSSTIWGAVVTGLAAVLPALGPAFGVSITPDTIHTGADQVTAIVQALVGLAGTIATIRGRANATQPLKLKLVTLKI